jgi:hypothetical protein
MTQCGHQPGFVSAPKLTIPRAISDAITAYLHTVRRFSLFIFIVSLSPSRQPREWDFAHDGNELMRLFFICALCAILIGCSRPVPPRGMVQTCTLQGCVTRTAATTPIEPKRAPFRPGAKIRTVKSKKVAMAAKPAAAKPRNQIKPVKEKANSRTVTKPEVPPSAQPSATPDPVPKNETTTMGGKTDGPRTGQPSETSDPVLNETAAAIGGKTEGPATGQPSETSDPVLKKAKITVAAKMENSASAEFVDMKRVMRENIFGQPFEVICGHVKGKKKSGEATGERSFLYLVKEDEAFIVGSNPDSMAAIAYRAHCISANSR